MSTIWRMTINSRNTVHPGDMSLDEASVMSFLSRLNETGAGEEWDHVQHMVQLPFARNVCLLLAGKHEGIPTQEVIQHAEWILRQNKNPRAAVFREQYADVLAKDIEPS